MILFSTASQYLYPNNTHYDFIVELAKTIDLGNSDKWKLGLREYACPPPKTGTYQAFTVVGQSTALIYSNLITPLIVGGQLVRCLRTIAITSQYCGNKFAKNHYFPVERRFIFTFIYRFLQPTAHRPPSLTASTLCLRSSFSSHTQRVICLYKMGQYHFQHAFDNNDSHCAVLFASSRSRLWGY